MQAYDLIMLIVLAMATIFGAIKGFAWQVASIASVIVSYLVAYNFRFEVANMIQATPPWNQFLAMLILYVGTSFAIWVGFRLFSGMIDRVRLKEFDRHLGAGFGFTKGLLYCLLITMFAMSLLGKNQQRAIGQSRSGYFIAHALDRGVGILPKEVHEVVGPYLARLDGQLKDGQQGPPAEVTDLQGLGTATGQNSIGGTAGAIRDIISQQLPAGVTNALENLSVPSTNLTSQQSQPATPGGTPNFPGTSPIYPPTNSAAPVNNAGSFQNGSPSFSSQYPATQAQQPQYPATQPLNQTLPPAGNYPPNNYRPTEQARQQGGYIPR
ncbi:MAG: CvpA family protein [Planctomycetota bacterium]